MPAELTVATPTLLLLQEPPEAECESVAVPAGQMLDAPPMVPALGAELMAIGRDATALPHALVTV